VKLGNDVYVGFYTEIGDKTTIGNNITINENVQIGNGVQIGNDVLIDVAVKIGAKTRIGNNVVLTYGNIIGQNVIIGNNVMLDGENTIGQNVIIGSDITIGRGVNIKKSPIYIIGSRDIVAECGYELLQIGYWTYSFCHWIENCSDELRGEDYSPEEIKEYYDHIYYAYEHRTIEEE